MLLAVDASHLPAVAVIGDDEHVVFQVVGDDPRGHAEAIGPMLAAAFDAAGACGAGRRIDAVVVGTGPGPFTGLRVGIAAAHAAAAALGVPVLAVLSHDATALAALDAGRTGRFAVVSDAKRRERYWTLYDGLDVDGVPSRLTAPAVGDPALLPPLPQETAQPDPVALARVALRRRRAGRAQDPDEAQYLRSPDVTVLPSRAVS